MPLVQKVGQASAGSSGTVLLLSANPIHDTGGGQRSAQLALEFLARDWCVVFVSHGEVTETRDLALRFDDPRLVSTSLQEFLGEFRRGLRGVLEAARPIIVTQVPVAEWFPVIRTLRGAGAVAVYDCIDLWDSELGRGWYRRTAERRIAQHADVAVATAPSLVHHVSDMVAGPVHALPNAFNARLFHPGAGGVRPADLPADGPVALYVGALWGSWLDWALVGRLAARLPHVSLTFVGDHRGEGGRLPPNCHFLGLKAQSELPGYLAHAAVGFLPWKIDAVTRATSPLKVYEFLAMGLPVVAPELEPLRGLPGTTLAAGGEAFARAVEESARAGVDPATRAAMASFAARNSWASRVDDLLDLVARGQAGPRRPRTPPRPADPAGGRSETPRTEARPFARLRAGALELLSLARTDHRTFTDATVTVRSDALATGFRGRVIRSEVAARDASGVPIPGTFRGDPIDAGPEEREGSPPLLTEVLPAGFLFHTDPWSSNFQHFFVELFPKTVDYLAVRLLHGRVPLLVPPAAYNALSREIFDVLGVAEDVVVLRPDTVYSVRSLYSSGYVHDYGGITPKLVHSLRLLRARLALRYPESRRPPRRVHLARDAGASHAHNDNASGASRVITNHPALLDVLERHGFETVTLGRLSLAEKVHELTACEVLVSPLGANLVNCFFMRPPGPRAILLLCSDAYQQQGYAARLLRRVLGRRLRVEAVVGRAVRRDDVNSPYEVDPGAFEAALVRCLGRGRAP